MIVQIPKLRRRGKSFILRERARDTYIAVAGWRARFTLWLLTKAGYEIHENVTYYRDDTYVDLNVDDLTEAVYKLDLNLNDIWHYRAKTLYLGRDLYDRFIHEDIHPADVNINMKIGYNRDIQFRGLTVKLIPWMEGMLLV